MVARKRPPLPAPTDSEVNEDISGSTTSQAPDDDTDLSQRTDRTSYSIPEDGRPLTIPTKLIRTENKRSAAGVDETSLLIEYYQGPPGEDGIQSSPSVRVKVNPRARHLSQNAGDVKITQSHSGKHPVRVRRVPLGNRSELDQSNPSETSGRSPVEVEVMDKSEIDSEMGTRNVVLPSDVSSMPPDSMLDGPPVIKVQDKDNSSTSQKSIESQPRKKVIKATLKAPNPERTRSKSTERITQRAIEKLQREQEADTGKASSKVRPKSGGSDSIAASDKVRSKRSSRSHRDSDLRSGTESSLLPPRDVDSNVSSGSKISINNPKLLATVEDAIRRLILPEIETIKRNQSVRSTRTRDSFISDESMSRSGTNHRLSKSTSEPHVKTKSTADGYEDYALGNSRRKKHRESSRASSSSRRDSVDSISREKERAKKYRNRDVSETSLTRENLRSHESQSDLEERRQSDSIANTDEEYYGRKDIPPMPMASEIQDSELTRESLLSEETNDSVGDEHARAVPQTARQVPIIREVNRSSPSTVESPISKTTVKKPSPSSKEGGSSRLDKDNRSLKSAKSDRSISSDKKAAAYAAVGLSAAAAGLYGHASSSASRPPSRGKAPETSPGRVERKVSSESKQSYKKSPLSKESLNSETYPVTQKRHKGINLENEENGKDTPRKDRRNDTAPNTRDEEDDDFYEQQRELNNEYRSSVGYHSNRDSTDTNPWKDMSPERNPFNPFAPVGQQVRGVGANAQVVRTSTQPQSAIASLVEGSNGSFHSEDLMPANKDIPSDWSRAVPAQAGQEPSEAQEMGFHSNASAERWNAIRDHAQALSQGTRTISDTDSINNEHVRMSATGGPLKGNPIPEADYIYDDNSELTDHRDLGQKTPSVVEGRLGDEYENQGLWPYEPTPDIERRREGVVLPDGHSRDRVSGMLGAAGAGLGIGAATAAALGSGRSGPSTPPSKQRRGLPQDENVAPGASSAHQSFADRQASESRDEGYVTGDPGRSAGGDTPLSFDKPPPKLFDENDAAQFDPTEYEDETYSASRDTRHMSTNSHGLPGQGYDAATGAGIDHIQSQDVVALMDHLTVRDGHRNARDTEILVTLVRSAAEMKDNFDEMKKFIEMQNQATMKRSEQSTQSALSKIMSDARSMPTSTRNLRSVSGFSDSDEAPAKKQNIFKRALKGLGSRNERDLDKMESMLTRLLDEVESLRAAQQTAQTVPPPPMPQSQSRGLDSYERLRAAPDSGYEPEGHASTSTGVPSTPNSQPRSQRMHSGYAYNRDSHRISTVPEDDEDMGLPYENNDGMLTPTQENHRSLSYNTPPSGGKPFNSQFTPNTPKTGERRSRQQSTSSSMFGGIPKISRWSKTTTSSAAEGRPSFGNEAPYDGPYSEGSRSGSDINVLPGEQGPYEPEDDDRLRSADSLAREREYNDTTPGQQHQRSGSPLLPDDASAEDPKYKANRRSLTLQHPQPRQGSAHRHPPHLETQAQTYRNSNGSQLSQESQSSSLSPQNDVFGSVPGLAKNRYSAGESSSKRSTMRDDGPLIPSKDQPHHASGQSQNSTPRRIRDDDEDSFDSLEDAHYRRSTGAHTAAPDAPHGHDGQYDAPTARRHYTSTTAARAHDSYDSLDSDSERALSPSPPPAAPAGTFYPPPMRLERPVSPYSPGGLLEPIEERYSLEQSRLSSPMSRRDTLNSKKTSRIDEEDEEPLPLPEERVVNEERRRVTGPREMPAGRSASGGFAKIGAKGSG